MKNTILISLAVTTLLFSCSKESDILECRTSEASVGPSWVYPMTVGSYWKYQWYNVDSLGNSTPSSLTDSMTIVADTIINGELFAVYEDDFFGGARSTILRRDSSGFIINQFGQVDYSYVEFGEVYNEGSYLTGSLGPLFQYDIMEDTRYDSIISVPAGDYSAINREIHFYYDGSPVINPCGDTELVDDRFYVSGVGEIKSTTQFLTAFQSSCATVERRLVEFYIAD